MEQNSCLGKRWNVRGYRSRTADLIAIICATWASDNAPIGPAFASQFGPMSKVIAPPLAVTVLAHVAQRSAGNLVSRCAQDFPRNVNACHCDPSTDDEVGIISNGSFSSPAV